MKSTKRLHPSCERSQQMRMEEVAEKLQTRVPQRKSGASAPRKAPRLDRASAPVVDCVLMGRVLPQPPKFVNQRYGWDVTRGDDSCAAQKITPKNNERPKLFRVKDARAALPQNCSPKKIKWHSPRAYGTSVPYPLFPRLPPISLKNRQFPRSRRNVPDRTF